MSHKNRLMIFAALAGLTLGLTGCGDDDDGAGTPDSGSPDASSPDAGPQVPADCDRWVQPGDDDRTTVQTMFEEAQDGETLCFLPGTYGFDDGVTIADKTGITLRGTGAERDDVVLDFFEMGTGNSGLNASSMTQFTIENMQVLDATANDVFVTDSTDVTIRNVSAGWVRRPVEDRGRYALYPVQSTRVIVEDSEAFGSADAGIYVGQTDRCIVRNSTAHDNVAGIEIENSSDCEVHGNTARNNTAGLLVFELPGLERRGSRTLVYDNEIIDNNLANFAPSDGGIVALVPAGIGIMILAGNQIEVRDNIVRGNDSIGVAVVSYHTPIVLGAPEPMDAKFEWYPDDVCIRANTYEDNGTMPVPTLAATILGQQMPPGTRIEDIVWDGALAETQTMAGDALCIDATGTYRMADISDTFMTQSTDRAPVTCACTPVDPMF